MRAHFHFADIIYDQPSCKYFASETELMHHNAVLAKTGAIKSSSYDLLNIELELEFLFQEIWMRQLFLLSSHYLYFSKWRILTDAHHFQCISL